MYICEGNTGGGKTTFLRLLSEKYPKIKINFEPLVSWQKEVQGESIFGNFFKNPKRWSFAMETYTMLSRVKEHILHQENIKDDDNVIFERSIYSGYYVFAISSYKSGFMTPLEWALYNEWFEHLISGKYKPPKGFIYLKVDPEVSYKRLQKRAREGESQASLEYWKQLNDCYENFLVEKENVLPELKNVPVLVIDGNEEFEADSENFEKMAVGVKGFLASTK